MKEPAELHRLRIALHGLVDALCDYAALLDGYLSPAPSPEPPPSAGKPDRGMYDGDGAAEYLGVSVSWLEKTRVYGTGPAFVKLGRRVLYRRADLDEWIAAARMRSTSAPSGAGAPSTVVDGTRFLRLRDVTALTKVSRSTLWRRVKEGTFPKPVPLGSQTVGWVETEVEAWCQARMRARISDDDL